MGRLLLVIVVVLIAAFVLGGAGALDATADIVVSILRAAFELLVRLIDVLVNLIKSTA